MTTTLPADRTATLRRRRGAVALVSAALALGLVPAVAAPAYAGPGDPAVSFVDTTGGSGAALSTSAINPTGTTTRLTTSDVATDAYDVSDDGNTLLVGGVANPAGADTSDATYGLVLVTRVGGTTTSRLLATDWYGSPALSADGQDAYWLSNGTIYKFDGTSTTVASATTAFAWSDTEFPTGMAISPDGTHAAVIYRGPGTTGRIRAASLASGISAPYFEKKYTAEPIARPNTLTWIDADTVLFSEVQYNSGAFVGLTNRSASLIAGGNASLVGSLADFYDINPFRGTFWMWKDGTTSDFGTSADPLTAPGSLFAGLTKDSTYYYKPSEVAPPVMSSAPSGRPTSNLTFAVGATATTYGRQVPYLTANEYLKAVTGYPASNTYFTQRGILQSSINGRTFTTMGTTSGASTFDSAASPFGFFNGYSKKLTRTTWLRYYYPGDAFTAPATSSARRVGVAPIVTAKAKKKGSKRIVLGSATRVGGKVALYKGSKKLATATISAKGAFKFKARSLAKGTYTLKVAGDASWDKASKKLKI